MFARWLSQHKKVLAGAGVWIVWERQMDKQSACLETSQNVFGANKWLINTSLLVQNAQLCSVLCTSLIQ